MSPQLQGRHSILIYRPERLVYAELIFDESGRLATLLLLQQQVPQQEELGTGLRRQLRFLVNEDTGCRLPTHDGQTIDLRLVLVALMGEADWNNAQRILADVASLARGADAIFGACEVEEGLCSGPSSMAADRSEGAADSLKVGCTCRSRVSSVADVSWSARGSHHSFERATVRGRLTAL
ncbi:MAG: hypothetical protein KDG53_14060 [Rhodocyclaceae bacterium]|nr:hypothetical protein [Rhodocyclaceae bacterium]